MVASFLLLAKPPFDIFIERPLLNTILYKPSMRIFSACEEDHQYP